MSATPGMPEYGGLADRIKNLEDQVAKLNRARKLQSASIGSGGLAIKDGGTIRLVDDNGDTVAELDKDSQTFFDSNGDPLTVLDGSGLSVGDAPVVLDADGLDIANGLTVVDDQGLRVGSDVVVDADGLEVIGGMVTPIWPATAGASEHDVSLTTTQTDFLTVTLNPPDWVQRLVILSAAFLRVSNGSGSTYNMLLGVTNDNGGASEQRVASGGHSVEHNQAQTTSVFNREDILLSPNGRSVDVVVDGALNSGTNSENLISLSVIGFGLRTS